MENGDVVPCGVNRRSELNFKSPPIKRSVVSIDERWNGDSETAMETLDVTVLRALVPASYIVVDEEPPSPTVEVLDVTSGLDVRIADVKKGDAVSDDDPEDNEANMSMVVKALKSGKYASYGGILVE
jgi:hypothetical protein